MMKPATILQLILTAAALLCAATLHARNVRPARYYVAENGDDAAKGSIRRPFRTINRALQEAGAGDTVFVRGGTYREQVEFFTALVYDFALGQNILSPDSAETDAENTPK